MKTISMLELRKNSEELVKRLKKGDSLILSYRGKALARLVSLAADALACQDDPVYRLGELAEPKTGALSNRQIDEIIYG